MGLDYVFNNMADGVNTNILGRRKSCHEFLESRRFAWYATIGSSYKRCKLNSALILKTTELV